MNYHDLTFTRGIVIDKFIGIEFLINIIISAHFLGRVETNFVVNVLNNEMSSFGFKKTILKQIVGEKIHSVDFRKLEELNRIRNLFGHGSLKLKDDLDITSLDAELWINDPKKVDQPVDPEAVLKTYNELIEVVSKWLTSVGKQKGVPYPQEYPYYEH